VYFVLQSNLLTTNSLWDPKHITKQDNTQTKLKGKHNKTRQGGRAKWVAH